MNERNEKQKSQSDHKSVAGEGDFFVGKFFARIRKLYASFRKSSLEKKLARMRKHILRTEFGFAENEPGLVKKAAFRFAEMVINAGLFCIDHWHMLFFSAQKNHERIVQKKHRGSLEHLEESSIDDITEYQKKTRIMGGLSTAMALALVAFVLIPTVFKAHQSFADETPAISSISPNNGGTGGGTNVTIAGTGFSSGVDNNTTLLLHADGSGTSFTDSSISAKTVTANGSATQTTAQSKFGGSSALFNNATSSYLSVPDSDDFYFNGDFTIDFNMRWNGAPSGYESIMGQSQGGGVVPKWMLIHNLPSANKLSFDYVSGSSEYVVTWDWAPAGDTWYHVAIVRSGNTWYAFVNGTSLGSRTQSAAMPNVSAPLRIGTDGEAWQAFNGYLDEVRISKGIARWTSNFTPLTTEYSRPNVTIGGTQATNIQCASPTTITATTAAHSAGTGDVLITNRDSQTATLTNGFTYNLAPTISSITPSSGTKNGGDTITIAGTNFLSTPTVTFGGTGAVGVSRIDANTLSVVTPAHVADTVDVVVTNPDSQSVTQTGGFSFLDPAPTFSSISPNSGSASGGTNVTVSGTNFATFPRCDSKAVNLWHFEEQSGSGAYLIDSCSANNGTPSGTTSANAYAGKGRTLNGTSDYISVANSSNFNFGANQNFAIELWANIPATQLNTGADSNAIIEKWIGDGGPFPFAVRVYNQTAGANAGKVSLTRYDGTNNPAVVSTVALNDSAWHHLAFVKNGSSLQVYVDGSLNNTATDTTTGTTTNTNNLFFGERGNGRYFFYGSLDEMRISNASRSSTEILQDYQGGLASLKFDGVSATNLHFVDANTVTATTPAHAFGQVNVAMTNVDGQSATLTSGFMFTVPPTISAGGISPASAKRTGGDAITITGTGFYGTPTVTLGGTSATNVAVVNSTTITATTPAHAAGTVNVVIINPDGQSATLTNGFAFTELPPTVSSISPDNGSSAGGTNVTVSGTGFLSGVAVSIGGVSATSVTVVNSTTITAVSGAHAFGQGDVTVTNYDSQSDTLSNGFMFTSPPTVTGVSPSSGLIYGGDTVTITGTYFYGAPTVAFGSTNASSVTLIDQNTLSAVTPVHAEGAVNVKVTNPNGDNATLTNGFTFINPPPTVTGVSPAKGNMSGGTSVTITGTYFYGTPTVTFGGTNATNVARLNATTLTATTPAHSAGTVDILVQNPDSQSGTLTGGYRYLWPAEMQAISASEGSDGNVTVQYEVRDNDTALAPIPGHATMSLQYCTANCSSAGSETWADASTTAGNIGDVSVQETSWTSYQIVWNAKTDYANQYIGSMKIRLKADDNEASDTITYASSNAFVLDTKNPTVGASPIMVNASVSPSQLTLSSSDDSALEMKVSLISDLAGASWESYNSSKTITLATDPDTVYVQFKDVYGNTTSIYSAANPETPAAMMVQDTTNINESPAEYRMFVAWKVVSSPAPGFGSYKLYRSLDQSSWGLVSTITDRTVNYYVDNGVSADTLYYYRVNSVDANGNISANSSIVNGRPDGTQNEGEGGGGSPDSAPVISGVSISSISSTSATVSWDTDKVSNSSAAYITTNDGNFTNAPMKGIATMADSGSGIGRHSLTVSGLVPSTAYYLKLSSTDAGLMTGTNDNGGNGFTFTTLSGPVISGANVSSENDSATISWNTNVSSVSKIAYSTSILAGELVDPIEIGPSESEASHSQTIGGLSANVTYYFSIIATDGNGARSEDDNTGAFYSFITNDLTDPVMGTVSESVISTDQVAVHWTTDEQSSTQVRYAQASGGPYTTLTEDASMSIGHYAIISGLSADTTYYYQAISRDISGNETISAERSFTTEVDPSASHDPLSAISNIPDTPSVLTDKDAIISFDTDQAAKCFVEYGTTSGTYNEIPVAETDYNSEHAIHLASLLFSTQYYYKITCEDNLSTVISSSEKSFTTLAKQINQPAETVADTTAPSISNINVSKISGESVTITWDTDEKSSGLAAYGLDGSTYSKMVGDYTENATVDSYVTSHSVLIDSLIPSTQYSFKIISTDASGNAGSSSDQTFTTNAPSSLSSVQVVSQALGQATVTWKTSQATTSTVEYGATTSYGDKKESNQYVQDHSVSISGLTLGTVYHFRVKGIDKDNNLYSSTDNTFQPKAPPKISGVSIGKIDEHGATVEFTTDVPTDANIIYTNTNDDTDTGSQGIPDLLTAHVVALKNLSSGATYAVKIKVRDEQGNETQQDAQTFTTNKDVAVPVIDEVKTDAALTQDNKVQAIISWKTDEPSTTALLYQEGNGGEEKEMSISDNPTINHTAVITSFKTGMVYYFETKSVDQAGNVAVSNKFALLTPSQKENVIQIIINNFQDIFSWTGQ